jgi:hypothetical protein
MGDLLPEWFLLFQLLLLHYDTLKAHNMQSSAWPDVPTVFSVSGTAYVQHSSVARSITLHTVLANIWLDEVIWRLIKWSEQDLCLASTN